MNRDENGELIQSQNIADNIVYKTYRKCLKQALIDSKLGLFGFYEDADGNLYMNCNGGEFYRY